MLALFFQNNLGAVNGNASPAGVAAIGSVGTTTASGQAVVLPSGVSAAGSIGAVTATGGARAQPSGLSASGFVGTASASGNVAAPVVESPAAHSYPAQKYRIKQSRNDVYVPRKPQPPTVKEAYDLVQASKQVKAPVLQNKAQNLQEESKRLDFLMLGIEQAMQQAYSDAEQYELLHAQQAAIQNQQAQAKAQQDSLATLIAYEALMRRMDEQDIEMLLLAL